MAVTWRLRVHRFHGGRAPASASHARGATHSHARGARTTVSRARAKDDSGCLTHRIQNEEQMLYARGDISRGVIVTDGAETEGSSRSSRSTDRRAERQQTPQNRIGVKGLVRLADLDPTRYHFNYLRFADRLNIGTRVIYDVIDEFASALDPSSQFWFVEGEKKTPASAARRPSRARSRRAARRPSAPITAS